MYSTVLKFRSASEASAVGAFLVVLVATFSAATGAGAQSRISLGGLVTDPSGAPIAEAHIGVDGHAYTTFTDAAGRFRVSGVGAGSRTLRVRRLGFSPTVAELEVPPGGLSDVAVRLTPLPTILAPISVQAGQAQFSGRLADYYERLARRGNGYFITREWIDRENPRMLTQLLERVPGIVATRMRAGGKGVRLRSRGCWPLVWIDGVVMPAGEVDLDAFPPHTLHGIEIYMGSTGAPVRYTHVRDYSSCGTILLWSRGPDTDPVDRTPRTSQQLERLVASQAIYTADKVDVVAALEAGTQFEVVYPPSLAAERVGGVVMAEFVVGPGGRVESETFGIITAPHPLMSEAVRHAVARARYTPATRSGNPVRQLVQQPFHFRPDQGRVDGTGRAGVAKARDQ